MSQSIDLFSVKGKVALVTGGTSGIGRMMAEGLVAGGAKVYLVARNAEDCCRVASELTAGGDCCPLPGDLSTVRGIRAIATAFAATGSALHILVNNAGMHKVEPIDDFSESSWDDTVALNLKAAFFLVQSLLPSLRKGGRADDPARIVNVGSGHGIRVPRFESYAYQASKAGLHHLTRSLAGRAVGARAHHRERDRARGVPLAPHAGLHRWAGQGHRRRRAAWPLR